MTEVHALLAGCSDAPSVDRYDCIGSTYRVIGANPPKTVIPDPGASAFVFPVANAKQKKLYVKRSSGEIWRYDLDTLSNPEFIGAFGSRGNFLVDENNGALYVLNYFGDLLRVDTEHKTPAKPPKTPAITPHVVAPAIFDVSSWALFAHEPVLQWHRPPGSTSTSEICIQVGYGGSFLNQSLFPDAQAILRFDPVNSVLLPELVSKADAAAANGIYPSNYFTFGPDGLLYVLKALPSVTLPPQVWRFDGATGAFKDVFISQGITENPIQIFFAPDGKSLLLIVYDTIFQYDLTGAVIGTIPLAHAPPGYCAFITQQIHLPAFPSRPQYPPPFLISILAGVVGDNAGWDRTAERVWNSLDVSEKDAVIACGIRELSSLMTAPKGKQEIRRAIETVLGEKTLARLAVLLRMRGDEGS